MKGTIIVLYIIFIVHVHVCSAIEIKEIISYIVGSYDYFMQKEIFEQPESIMNTMRGRVKFGDYSGESLKPM
jgi:glucosamine 6-phosphate synthetase-like amidotransferase/phosphosugar isomerase protein